MITSAIAHAFVARRWLLLRQLFIAGLMFTFCNSKLPFFSQTPVIGLFFSPFLGRLLNQPNRVDLKCPSVHKKFRGFL